MPSVPSQRLHSELRRDAARPAKSLADGHASFGEARRGRFSGPACPAKARTVVARCGEVASAAQPAQPKLARRGPARFRRPARPAEFLWLAR
jgi:hypothetical protein